MSKSRLAWLGLVLAALPCEAADRLPDRTLAQYQHQRWTPQDGAPSQILSMAQDRAGFLWIGCVFGLFRFDGISFEQIPVQLPGGVSPKSASLFVDGEDVWVWFAEAKRFGVYRKGSIRLLPPYPDQGFMIAIARTPDGSIWTGSGLPHKPLLRFRNGKWEQLGADWGVPDDALYSLKVSADGAVWLSYTGSVLRLPPGGSRFEKILGTPGRGGGRLALDPQGQVWLSATVGVRRLSGPGGRGVAPSIELPPTSKWVRQGPVTFDRLGGLWRWSGPSAIERIADPARPSLAKDTFDARGGLATSAISSIIEDREGNVWVGGVMGLDKFRRAPIVVEPALRSPSGTGDVLLAARDGSVYIGENDFVARVRPFGRPEVLLRGLGEVAALCEAPDRALWIVAGSRVRRLSMDGAVLEMAGPASGNDPFYDCLIDNAGRPLLSAGSAGLFRLAGKKWEQVRNPLDGGIFYAHTLVQDRDDILVSHRENQVVRLRPNGSGSLALAPNQLGEFFSFHRFGRGFIAPGAEAIAWFDGARVKRASYPQAPALKSLGGLVQTTAGDSWLTIPTGLVRLRTADFARMFDDATFRPAARTLGFEDGLPGLVNRQVMRSEVLGGDGRIWISTTGGTAWLDTGALRPNPLPPGVEIRTIAGEGFQHSDPAKTRLPAGASNVTIGFSALSLAAPEQVKVRYMLEGVDRSWIDPGRRREAFYTNLSPGTYRFRVIAANADGVWNRTGATADFEVPPTFFQSGWFRLLALGAIGFLIWLALRIRTLQLSRRIRARMEERLIERERIARELHDTLLQSIQGLVFRLHAVARRMAPAEPARAELEQALERADTVIAEGRDAVAELRVREDSGSLPQFITKLAGEQLTPNTTFEMVVEGIERPLQGLAAVELQRIFAEALFNVAQHARASHVEATISYGATELLLQLRDNGVGIPNEVLDRGGREGHFGLIGMAERARRMGASLSITSAGGTTLTLNVPARLVYAQPPRAQLLGFRDWLTGAPRDER